MWLIETPPYRERFAELKRFARFDQEDASWLLKLREHARPRFEAIARAFYERAREHQEAHAVFQDDAQIERLHVSLVDWMERILTGPHDDAYCDISMRIGQAHVRVGLPQRYMFGGMNVVRQHMRTLIEERMPEHAHRVGLALDRILDVELALMNETYRDAYVTRLQRMAEDQPVASRREQLHVAAVELAGVLIVGLDADGYIQLFNHEAERITGYAADVVRSKRFADMFVEADACGFSEAWQSVL
jgi:PAS domain-containing protein